MDKQKTLVFIGAHPDDESFGIGGTLVQYTAAGYRAYYICGTRGEVGLDDPSPANLRGFESVGDLRWHELECAAEVLGLSGVRWLGYRDSGMPGSPDNTHPDAFAAAPVEEAAGRVVKILRELKPEVVITHDPIGGYRHPDHIAAHNAAVKAYWAASDPEQYPEAGPVYQPQKLYYHTMPHRLMKLAVKLMPLFGGDPHHFGRHGDVDLTKLVETEFPVHAVIKINKKPAQTRLRAVSCHASQLGGGSGRGGILNLLRRLTGPKDSYMRADPPPKGRRKEKDLFEGVV
ncbi:MAG: PIG-L family deacetylase [Dehalococcoidales bacterium]|nr:PIG-L family deacetylase [Dehalococcoidales bacterium]